MVACVLHSRVVLFHPRRHKKSYNSCRPEKNTVYQFRSSSRYVHKNKMRMRWWWSSAQVPTNQPTTYNKTQGGDCIWGVCNSQYDLESAQVIPIDIAQGMFSSSGLVSPPHVAGFICLSVVWLIKLLPTSGRETWGATRGRIWDRANIVGWICVGVLSRRRRGMDLLLGHHLLYSPL